MYRLTGGVLLGWTLGANDSANVFGPGVASGAIRFRLATILTAAFALAGALLEGPRCMVTLSKLSDLVPFLAFIASVAAGLTMLALTLLSLPASTSQAIVGALVGVGLYNGTANGGPLIKILICWAATPIGGALFGFVLYIVVGKLANRFVSGISRFDTFIRWGIVIAGCYGAYSLGANNVANSTGPFVGAGLITPFTACLVGGLSIGFGAITFSRSVMITVGSRITSLGPLAALIAILAQALTVHFFTCVGVPVSTSQAVVGAVAGIGLVRGISSVSRPMLFKILAGWAATPLLAGVLAFLAAAIWSAITG
ncbi:MAG: inorganic phosphate transporter [Planctomycetota bacterium]|jgi:PiT family inorganic phosphate transporter